MSWIEMPFLSGSALHIVGSASSTRAHRKFGFCCYTGTKWLLWVFFIEGTGTFIPLLASDFLPVVMQLDWQVGFNVCRQCHVLPSSVSWSCFVELCILSELLAVVSQPVVCWSCSAEVCLFQLESYSFAFHECMLFLAISSFNTYLCHHPVEVRHVCLPDVVTAYTHRCTTVLMSWVHASDFVYSHSYTCRFEFWMETVRWQVHARASVFLNSLSLSDLRAWMVCLWRWQCWCNTTSPPVTQQPQW